MKKSALLLATSTLTIGLQNTSAYACSLPSCQPGDIFPTTGTVPANALAWFLKASTFSEPTDAGPSEDNVKVFVVSGDGGETETELELTGGEVPSPVWPEGADEVWVPAADVPVGSHLRVESSFRCSFAVPLSELTVAEPATIPTSLGTLHVTTASAPLLLWTDSASCVERVPSAYADVEVQLSAEALPFADVLRYSLLVDGEHYRATDFIEYEDEFDTLRGWVLSRRIVGSEHGPGKDRAFATCGSDLWPMQGVEPGQHELQMVALLPNGTLITSDVVSVDLTCPPCGADAGPDCTETSETDAGAPPTSAEPDASLTQQPDTDTQPDSGAPTTTGVASPNSNTLGTNTSHTDPTSTQTTYVDRSTAPLPGGHDVDDETKDRDASLPGNTKPTDDEQDEPTTSTETPMTEAGSATGQVSATSPMDGGAEGGLETASAPNVKKRDSGCSTAPTTPRSTPLALVTSLLGLAFGTRRRRRALNHR